jgi:hypothetical protein
LLGKELANSLPDKLKSMEYNTLFKRPEAPPPKGRFLGIKPLNTNKGTSGNPTGVSRGSLYDVL